MECCVATIKVEPHRYVRITSDALSPAVFSIEQMFNTWYRSKSPLIFSIVSPTEVSCIDV
jgi:hypothetical protein